MKGWSHHGAPGLFVGARRITLQTLATLVHVLAVALVTEVAVRLLPLPAVVRLAGITLHARTASTPERPELTPAEARAVSMSDVVMRRWPWGTGTCLRRSLVRGHLVRRLRPTLRLGVRKDAATVSAHAWLEMPGARNVGGRDHTPFTL